MTTPLSRRHLIQSAAAIAASSALPASTASAAPTSNPKPSNQVTHGNIKQSVVNWCYSKIWDKETFCSNIKAMGCKSLELCDPKDWPTLKKHGLTCAIAGSHGFTKGLNNPDHWDECLTKIRERIDAASAFGVKSVISFTGMREPHIDDEQGAKNCVEGFKKIVGYAEKKNVTICLEMLNSRDPETMKGHPGYQGDHTDYCIEEILKPISSPSLKLLFDIYHVQIMDGDVIRRIRQYPEWLGHIHTAGNPGRCELDDTQEINYPPIMRALLEVGYKGFVGQEFIPTREPIQGLQEAIKLCDV